MASEQPTAYTQPYHQDRQVTPRRIWELPLAILLWIWVVLALLFPVLFIAGVGAGTLSGL
jgi:hypothetical protein